MYTEVDYPTKKALKEAVAKGEEVRVYNTGLGGKPPENGKVYLEGPHYPKPHKWYAEATLEGGRVVKVK